MTNYKNYPRHRFIPNSCIIWLEDGTSSWCNLGGNQGNYLLNSNYLDKAIKVDVKMYSRHEYRYTVEQFKEWLRTDNLDENLRITYSEEIRSCPECGKKLILRTARRGRNVGSNFWGCSGYPSCCYTQGVEDELTKGACKNVPTNRPSQNRYKT